MSNAPITVGELRTLLADVPDEVIVLARHDRLALTAVAGIERRQVRDFWSDRDDAAHDVLVLNEARD